MRHAGLVRCGDLLEHHDKAEQRRDRKGRWEQAHDLVVIGRSHEAMHQEELERPGHRRYGPRDYLVAELPPEEEWEEREHSQEDQVPSQRLDGVSRVKVVEVPCGFQRRHANHADDRHPFD